VSEEAVDQLCRSDKKARELTGGNEEGVFKPLVLGPGGEGFQAAANDYCSFRFNSVHAPVSVKSNPKAVKYPQRKKKDPNAPKRPCNAYLFFSMEQRPIVSIVRLYIFFFFFGCVLVVFLLCFGGQ